nr:uncharacterized protein LOC124805892 [Hydra vulgaris]
MAATIMNNNNNNEQNAQLIIDLLKIQPEHLQALLSSSNKDKIQSSEGFTLQEGLSSFKVETSVASYSNIFSTEVFLSEIRKYPCLWDVSHQSYKDRSVKMNAWKEISTSFETEILQKKLKNLKDTLKKCFDKRNKMTKSGAGASALPKCKYYEEMLFLHDKNNNISTQSNFELEETITENEDQIATPIAVKAKKRKISNEADKKIMQELSNFDNELKKVMTDSQCEDTLYCQSLVPILKSLPLKKKE